MMIREITEENIQGYLDFIPAELLGEIKREYWRGLAGTEETSDGMTAGVLWELKNMEDEEEANEAEIMWFYAKNASDGEGVLESLNRSLKNDEVKRVYFEIPSLSDEEEKALSASGYTLEITESRDIYVSAEEIGTLKISKKKPESYVHSLSDISPRQFKAGIMTCVFHDRYGLLEDLPFLPMTRFDPDLSCCVLTDGSVDGFLLVHKITGGPFIVELLFAEQPDADIHLLNMMRFAARAVARLESPETKVLLRKHNKGSTELIRKLFPGKKGEMVCRGELKLFYR